MYDEDKEFEDKLDEVVLENAKVVALTGLLSIQEAARRLNMKEEELKKYL